MKLKISTTPNHLVALLLLGGCCCFSTWLYTKELYIPAASVTVVAIAAIMVILRLYRSYARKLTFMFNSIENGDYSFKFTDDQIAGRDPMVNRALNRIKELLTRARDETIAQERYYQLILESTNTGIVVINQRGNVCQTNHEALRLLGVSPLTHLTQLSRLDTRLPEMIRTLVAGESNQITCSNERGSHTLSLHAAEIMRHGDMLKIVAILDIENELNDREIESWTRLIRVLTHEIMNSVGPITSISESLMTQIDEQQNPQVRHGLSTISQTAKHLSAFVDSYRRFTRIPRPEPTLFYVADFLSNLRSMALNMDNATPDLEITLNVEPDDLILHADRGLVSQVVVNLLKNAVDATALTPSPSIKITAAVDAQEQVTLTFEDNGPGIPPEVADHIFIPFFTTKDGGSGIGLSLSRQIMSLHGGTLRYRPAQVSGSVFTMTFK